MFPTSKISKKTTMSNKNKAIKQLLKAQMQTNAAASAQGKDISIAPASINTQSSGIASAPVASDKQISEFALIKKDINLSLLLIIAVVILLVIIYFSDHSHPFLLPLANKIFKVLQK